MKPLIFQVLFKSAPVSDDRESEYESYVIKPDFSFSRVVIV